MPDLSGGFHFLPLFLLILREATLHVPLLRNGGRGLPLAHRPLAARGMTAAIDPMEFLDIVRPLIRLEQVQQLSEFRHHRSNTRLDHSLEVAWHSYVAAKRLRLDYSATVRGAVLHDLFLYDRTTENPRFHGRRHPMTALNNALEIVELSEKEQDIIKRHMWPLTFMPPRYPESWIVCVADTCCAAKDFVLFLTKLRNAEADRN